jgi:glycosyltransferase 2 family protein
METYAQPASRGRGYKNVAVFLLQLVGTGACLWYVTRQISVASVGRIFNTFDLTWAGLAVVLLMAETPLVGIRWSNIVDALQMDGERVPRGHMIAITAIAIFTAQILPTIATDGVRVWLLARLGRTWQQGLASAFIDRGVGILALVIVGFIALLLPSEFEILGEYRIVLLGVLGLILIAALLGIVLVPAVVPMLERWRFLRPMGQFATAAHYILVRSSVRLKIFGNALVIHTLTILTLWSLGRAQGLPLSVVEAAVLFTLIVAISLVPISISGWGPRELVVTTLLQSQGIPAEQALFYSISFGLTAIVAALPGAIVWLLYSPPSGPRPVPVQE